MYHVKVIVLPQSGGKQMKQIDGTAGKSEIRTIRIDESQMMVVKLYDLTDDCIERIAEAVVRKIEEEKDE